MATLWKQNAVVFVSIPCKWSCQLDRFVLCRIQKIQRKMTGCRFQGTARVYLRVCSFKKWGDFPNHRVPDKRWIRTCSRATPSPSLFRSVTDRPERQKLEQFAILLASSNLPHWNVYVPFYCTAFERERQNKSLKVYFERSAFGCRCDNCNHIPCRHMDDEPSCTFDRTIASMLSDGCEIFYGQLPFISS